MRFGEHRVMYRPLESHDQRLISADLVISPDPAQLGHAHDVSGAAVAVARFEARSERLTFESQVSLEHICTDPFALEEPDANVGAGARFAYHRDDAPELTRHLAARHPEPDARAWALRFLPKAGRAPISSVLSDMTEAIRAGFAYRLRLDGAPQAPADTLSMHTGSCRDFAVLMIEAARSLGIAARFVSGYVYSASGGGRAGGGHTHAWVQAYIPGCGWTDFDPTNGIVGNRDLIRVACVADPRLAIPLHGAFAGARSDFLGMDVEVAVRVERTTQPNRRLGVARGA